MKPDEIEKFKRDGWVIMDIPQPEIIHEFAEMLEKKAQELTRTPCTLSTLHEYIDDKAIRDLHITLSQYFWENEFSLRTRESFISMLKDLMGLDIMVQYKPFLRIARPGRAEDNIGYHRDTYYGQTPHEMVAHLPFVDLDESMALKVVSGSHRLPESAFPLKPEVESGFTKGSVIHSLGLPYAPVQATIPDGMKTDSLTMTVGQVTLFAPGIIHGQEINNGKATRVTADMRYVSSHVNVKTGKDVRAGYVPISCSPLQQTVADYNEAQRLSAVMA